VSYATSIAAVALSASLAVSASVPVSAGSGANDAVERKTAESACLGFNARGPAELVKSAPDGLGDWIVWVRDKGEDLWMCNASAEGNVYANARIDGDLLAGAGEQTIALVPVAARIAASGAAAKAERLCVAVGTLIEDVTVAATVDDGIGDFVVWLKNGRDAYWMCNASADGKLYVFEAVKYPINETPEASSTSARMA
jgi:hypothetical protein